MQQSIYPPAPLPACVVLAVLAAMMPLGHANAQDRYRVTRQENFRREPGPTAGLLASVNQGTELVGGATRSGWVEVTLEGWIWSRSLRELTDPEYDHAVNARSGENLRASPDGEILARLINGFWLKELEDRGDWIRVTRTGWMWGRSLEPAQSAAAQVTPGEAPGVPPEVPTATPVPRPRDNGRGDATLDRAVTERPSALRALPGGDTTATLRTDAPLQILDRAGEWVRVRTEGWVHESDLRPVSGDVLVGVSGAEVRARPGDFEGRTLQWTVQLLALLTSDGLRPELPEGQQYMLARGPVPEVGSVYVLLSEDQAREIERFSPLAQLVVLVRVRVGRDQYLGNPVVDLVQMSLRKP